VDRRDYSDPRYKKWRKAVFARDRWKCRMPGCPGVQRKLNAHHIRRWANYPTLRFVVSNGIALCLACHEKVCGHEEDYESQFLRLVSQPLSDAFMRLLMMKYGGQERG
jgi:hypothetical protein